MMSGSEPLEWAKASLQAYHDGELRGFSCWRFERRLARSPELRRELALLRRVGDWVREDDARAPTPDLWDAIARQLPAPEPADGRRLRGRGALEVLGAYAKPLAAVAAAAVAALVVLRAATPEPQGAGRVVRWIDSGDRSVLVDDRDGAGATVIWLLDAPGQDASRGGHRDMV